MTQYPTQLYYPDTELTSPYPIKIYAEHQARKWQVTIWFATGLTRPGIELPMSHTSGLHSTDSVTVSDIY